MLFVSKTLLDLKRKNKHATLMFVKLDKMSGKCQGTQAAGKWLNDPYPIVFRIILQDLIRLNCFCLAGGCKFCIFDGFSCYVDKNTTWIHMVDGQFLKNTTWIQYQISHFLVSVFFYTKWILALKKWSKSRHSASKMASPFTTTTIQDTVSSKSSGSKSKTSSGGVSSPWTKISRCWTPSVYTKHLLFLSCHIIIMVYFVRYL